MASPEEKGRRGDQAGGALHIFWGVIWLNHAYNSIPNRKVDFGLSAVCHFLTSRKALLYPSQGP